MNNKINDKLTYYYITDKDFEIDPEYFDKKYKPIFEHGVGFYITPNVNVMKGYAKSKYTFAKNQQAIENRKVKGLSSETLENLLGIINEEPQLYLHIFSVDSNILSRGLNVCEYEYTINNVNPFIQNVRTCLNGYSKSIDGYYKPNRDITVGTLIGEIWDSYFIVGHKINVAKDIKHLSNRFKEINFADTQLAIHSKNLGGEKWNDVFVPNEECLTYSEIIRRIGDGTYK